MTISESIGAWARGHSMEDTLAIMMSGEVIHFAQEEVCSTDSIAQTALTAAYMYFEIERERRREHRLMKVAASEFKIGNYFGFEQGSFRPSETSKYVVEMFIKACTGMGLSRIARWLNERGLTTVRGKAFTSCSVKTILSSPVYCGDILSIIDVDIIRERGYF